MSRRNIFRGVVPEHRAKCNCCGAEWEMGTVQIGVRCGVPVSERLGGMCLGYRPCSGTIVPLGTPLAPDGFIGVVNESVVGRIKPVRFGREFHPMSGAVVSSVTFLADSDIVRPAVLADEEKFRIHLDAYGITE